MGYRHWCLQLMGMALLISCIPACYAQKPARQQHEIAFKKIVLSFLDTAYLSEGVAVGDVNRDGKNDVMAGYFWFEAPDWKRHDLSEPEIHSIGGYGNSFLNFSMDVNQDGWIDFIRIAMPYKEVVWYENPGNNPGHWKNHLIHSNIGNESPQFVDVDGDGRPDILCNEPVAKKMIWIASPKKKGDTTWTMHVISNDPAKGTHHFMHGLGLADINLDGRKDVMIKEGWWEAPADRTHSDWTFHAAAWGPECAQMFALDLDGDGDQDVISSSAHNYGVWWYEQVKQADTVAWQQHVIDSSFSQSHGMTLFDMNADGNPDIITGKRFWAHNGNDPGEREPAVIYWYEYIPGKQPRWIRHLIDDNSGVGLHVVTEDMNKDGLPDIVISNKKGVFIFQQLKQ